MCRGVANAVRSFGLVIMLTVVGLVLFVFLVSALLHHDTLESLLFALALAVSARARSLAMRTGQEPRQHAVADPLR